MMWTQHKPLAERISSVLGKGHDLPNVVILRDLKFSGATCFFEVAIYYGGKQKPANMARSNPSKDLLRFDLGISSFRLALRETGDGSEANELIAVGEDFISVRAGAYRFDLTGAKPWFQNFRFDNRLDLVDANWPD